METIEKEISLVEGFEDCLAIEGVEYLRQLDEGGQSDRYRAHGILPLSERWTNKLFDFNYFPKLVTGALYPKYIRQINEKMKSLDKTEIYDYLTFANSQFITHTPQNRLRDFWKKYWEYQSKANKPLREPNDLDKEYAEHIWKSYDQYFYLFRDFTKKIFHDFTAGLLSTSSGETQTEKVKYESFNFFRKGLEYNYPLDTSVYSYKFSMRDNLDYLKKEIFENLIHLNKDERKPYLNRLKYDLENKKESAWAKLEDLEKWYKKYKVEIKEDDHSFFRSPSNPLADILMDDPPTFKETFEDDFNKDTESIQHDFYNYYYGFYIDEAIKFISEQLKETDPNQIPAPVQNAKLKTNLSVPQLALLFKLLNELKPDIFVIDTETELHRFIAANFETKKSGEDGISAKKLKNLFNQPDNKAAEFWEKHLYTLVTEIKKFK